MENIENTQTQQEQLQDAINRLIALWNQNPLLVEKLLTLAKNSITLLQLPNKELLVPFKDNIMLLQPLAEESLALFGDISLTKNIETLTPVAENPNQMNYSIDSDKNYVD
ncbi:28359_t:CDS:1 [Gigaspora margarita]|uniref:28359_t:CDS:1 n=1 Tax=Gigaspora margarita TaxID=4874 RepID=A0ABN7WHU2_GIGMA|nr:28359_t:CDS:1 [Gigaspora margarita]